MLSCFSVLLLQCCTASMLQFCNASLLQCFDASMLHRFIASLLRCFRNQFSKNDSEPGTNKRVRSSKRYPLRPRSPSFALIGYGICLESEKIYTFVGEYSKGACLNIHHSLFPAVKRGNLNGKQAGRLNFVHRLCGVRSDCFRVFHDLTAADCSPYIFKIFCYLCHCNKGTRGLFSKESKRQKFD